jgi:hypothetical protein
VRALILALATAVVVTGSAGAKGPDLASICGASRCVALHGDIKVWSLLEWSFTPFSVLDAPKPAPYYSITIRDWGKLLYVPSRSSIRIWQGPHALGNFPQDSSSAPYWRTLPQSTRPLFAKLVRGLEPRSAPKRWPA